MWQEILFIMSLSGTAMFSLYLFINLIAKQRFSNKWKFNALRISLLLYLLPLAWLKLTFFSLAYWLFPAAEPPLSTVARIDPGLAVNQLGDVLYFSGSMALVWITIILLGTISLIIVLSQTLKYRRTKRIAFTFAEEIKSGAVHTEFLRLKNEVGIKCSVRLFHSKACRSPMVIGAFAPAIFLPGAEAIPNHTELISLAIEHELFHIKHNDLLTKFIGLFAISVNWYNPVCYALYSELCNMCELYCDAEVMIGKNDDARFAYGQLILDLASSDKPRAFMPTAKIMSNNMRILKRRILAMKEPTLKTNKLIVCLVSVSMVLVSSIAAFAYEAPVVLTTDSYNLNHTSAFSAGVTPSASESLPYDCFFTNSDGIAYNLENYNSQEKILCFHHYQEGYFTDHVDFADGSCKVTYSHAKQCSVCNAIVVGETIRVSTDAPCPH